MSIPVYGLSGIDGVFSKMLKNVKTAAAANTAYRTDGRAFTRYASKIKDAARRAAITEAHRSNMRGLEGIFNTAAQKIGTGTATQKDAADFKKARVLIALADTDYDAYRLASIYMPYVVDIDEQDGGYIFPTQELADVAAWGEDELVAYCSTPGATELGKIKLFKKIGKAFSNAAKAVGSAVKTTVQTVAKATTSAVKSTVNAVKAGANVLKAGAQAVTGNTSGAKATLSKAGSQLKSSVVDPVKTAISNTKAIGKDIYNTTKTAIQDTIDITKETVKIAGALFKVLFIKINPVTVMIRSSLRGLISLNFLGMATRLSIGLLTLAEAQKLGYTEQAHQDAIKAVSKLKKLFSKMGGNESKLLKSIRNGANKKPLFKKDIRPDQKIKFASGDDGETTLGEPATVAAMVAACVGIVTSIWSWIKNIVAEKKAAAEQKAAEEKERKQKEEWAQLYEVDINGNPILDQYGQPIPKGQIAADKAAAAQAAAAGTGAGSTEKKNVWPWLIGGIVILGGGALLMSSKKSKKRR